MSNETTNFIVDSKGNNYRVQYLKEEEKQINQAKKEGKTKEEIEMLKEILNEKYREYSVNKQLQNVVDKNTKTTIKIKFNTKFNDEHLILLREVIEDGMGVEILEIEEVIE